MAIEIRKASKSQVPLKMVVTGPTGAGKTFSALKMAFGFCEDGEKVGFIDTENGSGELYSDKFPEYLYYEIKPPYTVAKLVEAIEAFEKEGVTVLIVDSMTHFWVGEGGLLQEKEIADARGGNRFNNWLPVTQQFEKMKHSFLQSEIPLFVACLRSKMEYVQEPKPDGRGTNIVRKGMAPIVRPEFEYEFTLQLDIDFDHIARATKDRTDCFATLNEKIQEQHGGILRKWQMNGRVAHSDKKERAELIEKIEELLVQKGKKLKAPPEEFTTQGLRDTLSNLERLPDVEEVSTTQEPPVQEEQSEQPKEQDSFPARKDKKRETVAAKN